MLRKALFLPLMAAAIGVPLLVHSGGDSESTSETDELGDVSLTGLESGTKNIYEPVGHLGEVFDFNLRPEAIESRWKSVTISSVNGYQIYRTSMLSGHGALDPVGALTYQFDNAGRMRQIDFSGYVGDPSKLVDFVTGKFGFARTDPSGMEFRPTTFSGHNGSFKLAKSPEYRDQYKIELSILR